MKKHRLGHKPRLTVSAEKIRELDPSTLERVVAGVFYAAPYPCDKSLGKSGPTL